MKRKKAANPGEILAEMLKAIKDFGIVHFIEVMNEIYDSSEIRENLNRLIFIALQKKPSANEYEFR